MPQIDDVSKKYLIAGLRLGQDVEGFVDSYHGPQELVELAAEVDSGRALDDLETAIATLEPSNRRSWLEIQARAMRMVARVAGGEQVAFREQVAESFDIEPEWVDEGAFEAAHSMLDRLLPGKGSLAERRQAYRAQFEIPAEQLLPVAEGILTELRNRTRAFVELPEGESVELRLVNNQPWSGYNWYLGNLKSRIEINTDLPSRLNDLPDLLAHEAYAGHHTEHCLKEAHQLRELGHGEGAIALLTTPQAVVSEGIATTAFETVVPQEQRVEWLRTRVYQPAGVDVDIENDLAISQASRALGAVSGNAALMLHEQGRPLDEVVEYISRYSLRPLDEARQSTAFLTHPLFRTYIYTYTVGYDLVSSYLRSQTDRHEGFRALLTDFWTPTRLRGADRRHSPPDERLPL